MCSGGPRANGTNATGSLTELLTFSFIVFTFDGILVLTKPLSNALQVKTLNPIVALELVDSVTQIRSEVHCTDHIWKESL